MFFCKVLSVLLAIFVICCNSAPQYDISTENKGLFLYVDSTENPIELAMKEIMDLVPKEKIMKIAEEHMETDPDFRAAVAYMKSPQWTNLIDTIRTKPQWVEFREYVRNVMGFDVEIFSKCTREFLRNIPETAAPITNAKRGFRFFMADVEKVIPVNKIIEVFYKRIVNTGRFKEATQKMSSDEFKTILTNLFAVPEFQQVACILQDMDINVREMFAMLQAFLGWPNINF